MSGNNLKVSGIINLPSLGSLRGKLLCPEQCIEGFASVPVGIVENHPRVPLLNSIEPSIGWSHPLTKKGDACSFAYLASQSGRGAIEHLAQITGMSPNTIRRGLADQKQTLEDSPYRVRQPGGGRKPV